MINSHYLGIFGIFAWLKPCLSPDIIGLFGPVPLTPLLVPAWGILLVTEFCFKGFPTIPENSYYSLEYIGLLT